MTEHQAENITEDDPRPATMLQAARRKASPPKPAPRPEGLMAGIRYDERAGRRAA
jgi:hypothetical protein